MTKTLWIAVIAFSNLVPLCAFANDGNAVMGTCIEQAGERSCELSTALPVPGGPDRQIGLVIDEGGPSQISKSKLSVRVTDGERVTNAEFNFPYLSKHRHNRSSRGRYCWWVYDRELFLKNSYFYFVRELIDDCGPTHRSWLNVLSFGLDGKPNKNVGKKGVSELTRREPTEEDPESFIVETMLNDAQGNPLVYITKTMRSVVAGFEDAEVEFFNLNDVGLKTRVRFTYADCISTYLRDIPGSTEFDARFMTCQDLDVASITPSPDPRKLKIDFGSGASHSLSLDLDQMTFHWN